jgi:hypothetical protein
LRHLHLSGVPLVIPKCHQTLVRFNALSVSGGE